jgi:hypothetical protein
MKIQQTPPYNPTMGLNRVPTRRIYYLPNGFLEKDIVKLKDHTLLITRNYPNGELSSTLFYLKDQAGRWIKSKLKYFEDGMQKCIRSENKCLNG